MEWRTEHLDFVKVKFLDGLTALQISQELNEQFHVTTTRNAVLGKFHRLKLKKPKETKEQTKVLVKKGAAWSQKIRPPTPVKDHPVCYGNCDIIELTKERCHWPVGSGPPYRYCGMKTVDGRYCAAHGKISRPAQP